MNKAIANRIVAVGVAAFLLLLILQRAYSFKYGVTGDERSYVEFSFSSLKAVLSNYRTFGFPLVINAYRLVFGTHYAFWPIVTIGAFVGSVLYFKASLGRLIANPILAAFAAVFLLWGGIGLEFNALASEPVAIIFVILSISALIRFVASGRMVDALVLLATTFFTYQVRPALITFPFCYVLLWGAQRVFRMERVVSKQRAAATVLITVAPLVLFMLLRLFVVGSFGVVAFTGFQLSGHAAYYLDEDTVPRLNAENVPLANLTLRRRAQMARYGGLDCSTPLVLKSLKRSEIKDRYLLEYGCFGMLADTAWYATIELYGGTVAPDGFVYGDNVETDKRMMSFALDVIRVNFRKYLEWVALSTLTTLYLYGFRPLLIDHVFVAIACVGSLAFVSYLRAAVTANTESDLVRFNDGDFRFCVFQAPVFALIYFLLNAIPLFVVAHPRERYIDVAVFFIGPALALAYVGLLFRLLRPSPQFSR